MHVLCDFAMLLELSYTFDHIWTNLLTQCTQLPVPIFCCFCISGFPPLKVLQKIWKNYIKIQRHGSFPNHQSGSRGPPPGAQAPWWRGQGGGRVGFPPGCLVAPSVPPLAYIYPPRRKPLISISYSRSPICTTTAAVSRLGLPGEAASAPCRKEEPPSGDHTSPWTPPGCVVSSPLGPWVRDQ